MRLRPLDSDAVRAIGYDSEREELDVEYEGGAVYRYFGVSELLYEALIDDQPHPWSRHGEEVKEHRYQRIR